MIKMIKSALFYQINLGKCYYLLEITFDWLNKISIDLIHLINTECWICLKEYIILDLFKLSLILELISMGKQWKWVKLKLLKFFYNKVINHWFSLVKWYKSIAEIEWQRRSWQKASLSQSMKTAFFNFP